MRRADVVQVRRQVDAPQRAREAADVADVDAAVSAVAEIVAEVADADVGGASRRLAVRPRVVRERRGDDERARRVVDVERPPEARARPLVARHELGLVLPLARQVGGRTRLLRARLPAPNRVHCAGHRRVRVRVVPREADVVHVDVAPARRRRVHDADLRSAADEVRHVPVHARHRLAAAARRAHVGCAVHQQLDVGELLVAAAADEQRDGVARDAERVRRQRALLGVAGGRAGCSGGLRSHIRGVGLARLGGADPHAADVAGGLWLRLAL
mmetsp:Transcript_20066/g.70951  ORF Transcript_20066/g.70951 Transcript_20066/m.70951 type:complete len:271 (-) Transcript_20066:5042-5854(-)